MQILTSFTVDMGKEFDKNILRDKRGVLEYENTRLVSISIFSCGMQIKIDEHLFRENFAEIFLFTNVQTCRIVLFDQINIPWEIDILFEANIHMHNNMQH